MAGKRKYLRPLEIKFKTFWYLRGPVFEETVFNYQSFKDLQTLCYQYKGFRIIIAQSAVSKTLYMILGNDIFSHLTWLCTSKIKMTLTTSHTRDSGLWPGNVVGSQPNLLGEIWNGRSYKKHRLALKQRHITPQLSDWSCSETDRRRCEVQLPVWMCAVVCMWSSVKLKSSLLFSHACLKE